MRAPRWIALLVLALSVAPASANIGLPMVAVFLPPLWLAIVPVVAVESWMLVRRLGLGPIQALKGAAAGNVLSTLVGIPFIWVVLATLELAFAGTALGLASLWTRVYAVTIQAPWLIPYEEDLRWMVPVALAVLAVPAYAVSVLIEWRALLPFVPPVLRPRALSAVAVANIASYAVLALLFLVTLGAQEAMRPLFSFFEPVTNALMELVFRLVQSMLPGPK